MCQCYEFEGKGDLKEHELFKNESKPIGIQSIKWPIWPTTIDFFFGIALPPILLIGYLNADESYKINNKWEFSYTIYLQSVANNNVVKLFFFFFDNRGCSGQLTCTLSNPTGP